ncbi:MAG: division/cell wall cluster transcriptional repressor MraZ [Christensenellales bacterium]|jgi:MraZ protein
MDELFMGFLGEYQHTLDQKGRLIMPSRFRDDLGEKFVIAKGTSKCLFVFPTNEFKEFTQRLRTLSLTDATAQAFLRILFASASVCEVDKQGRALISAQLREYAGLEKEAVITGAFNRVEIWNPKNWKDYSSNVSENYDEILEKMSQLGV